MAVGIKLQEIKPPPFIQNRKARRFFATAARSVLEWREHGASPDQVGTPAAMPAPAGSSDATLESAHPSP
jgi:hypothetical protein